MPETALATRFLSSWPGLFTPAGELVYEAPRRQRQLISIGQQQIEAQRASAKAIAKSNLVAAQIISAEINQQTAILEDGLRKYSAQVSSSIMDASEQISAAVELLGDRLCSYLGEIRWELAQQSEILTGILHSLRESRNNEARQLVEQGVRHYANEQYDRAEERFRQALEQDTTDFQVLMNLGLIAIQKDAADAALATFQDALRLPASLDKASKTRALLTIARTHYAKRDYQNAYAAAHQAALVSETPQAPDTFVLATYAALKGDIETSLKHLQQAIAQDVTFFNKAAVEPDLESHRQSVLSLLSKLSNGVQTIVISEIASARRLLERAATHRCASDCADAIARLDDGIQRLSRATASASYSDLLRLRSQSEWLPRAAQGILDAEVLLDEKSALSSELPDLDRLLEEAKRYESASPAIVHPFYSGRWVMGYLSVGAALYMLSSTDSTNVTKNNLLGWYVVLGWIPWLIVALPSLRRAEKDERNVTNERRSRHVLTIRADERVSIAKEKLDDLNKRIQEALTMAKRPLGISE